MSKVFSAHAVRVDGHVSGRTPEGAERLLAAVPAPGATHLHYEVVR